MDPNQPTNTQQPVQPEIPQDSKFSFIKYIKVWQIVILLILLIPTTAYLLNKNQSVKQIPTVQSSQIPIPTSDLTANWKTIKFNKLSFKIPSSWPILNEKTFEKLTENNTSLDKIFVESLIGQGEGKAPGLNISLEHEKTIEDIKRDLEKNSGQKFQEKISSVDGKKTLLLDINLDDGINSIQKYALIQASRDVYSFSTNDFFIPTYPLVSSYFDQILSTFKFPDQTTFEIKELGIKINLTNEIKDLGYVYKNNVPYFYTNYLIEQAKEKGGINNCTKEIGPIGAFSKIDKSTLKDDPNGPWDQTIQGIRAETIGKNGNLPLAKEFPSFFLFFSHPNNVCSNNQSIQQLQENQINSLQKSMQTAELTQ